MESVYGFADHFSTTETLSEACNFSRNSASDKMQAGNKRPTKNVIISAGGIPIYHGCRRLKITEEVNVQFR
jgi:hypothetical protein